MLKLNELWLKETPGKMADCGKRFSKPKNKKSFSWSLWMSVCTCLKWTKTNCSVIYGQNIWFMGLNVLKNIERKRGKLHEQTLPATHKHTLAHMHSILMIFSKPSRSQAFPSSGQIKFVIVGFHRHTNTQNNGDVCMYVCLRCASVPVVNECRTVTHSNFL